MVVYYRLGGVYYGEYKVVRFRGIGTYGFRFFFSEESGYRGFVGEVKFVYVLGKEKYFYIR